MGIICGFLISYLLLAYGILIALIIRAIRETEVISTSYYNTMFDYIISILILILLMISWPILFLPCYGGVEKVLFIKKG
jgi:uncharacterized protein HemY